MKRLVLLAAAVLAARTIATGETYDFDGTMVDVEYWSGTGSNEAVCVVDFGLGLSYAFGYRWDGGSSGFDMIEAIDAAGTLDFTSQDFGGGPFVTGFTYAGRSIGALGWPDEWWAYYNGTDGTDWDLGFAGVADRALVDGDWDGWYGAYNDAYPPEASPRTPPYGVAVLSGRETQLAALHADTPHWMNDGIASRALLAVVCTQPPASNGVVPVAGIDLIYAGVASGKVETSRSVLPATQMVTTPHRGTWLAVDHASPTHGAAGVLRVGIAGPRLGITSLSGPLMMMERAARAAAGPPLEGFSHYEWRLNRDRRFSNGWEVLDALDRLAR